MPKQLRLTLVDADDWQALYADGKLISQNHSVDIVTWLEKLNVVKIDEVWADNDPYLKENARFPDEMRAIIPDRDADLDKVR